MTDARTYLASIKERAEAATPGPWRWDEDFGDGGDTGLALTNDSGAEVVGAYNHHCCSFRDDPSVEDNDAAFIAHSRTDLPRVADALLAVLELHVIRGRNIWGDPVCNECSPVQPFPCPTVKAITEALEASL